MMQFWSNYCKSCAVVYYGVCNNLSLSDVYCVRKFSFVVSCRRRCVPGSVAQSEPRA